MPKVLYPAASRGLTQNEWLQSFHSFSFGEYIDPERQNFGALRVLNEDTVAPEKGFDEHPHRNMEIISIPLQGALEHRDTMGNVLKLQPGDVQLLSAGTGITHAEYNASIDEPVHFLQIWITPREQNLTPSYTQKTFQPPEYKNRLKRIVSADAEDHVLTIQQNAFISLGNFDAGREMNYDFKIPTNGVYIFVIQGLVATSGENLSTGDAMGISGIGHLRLKAVEAAEFLLLEVPMIELNS